MNNGKMIIDKKFGEVKQAVQDVMNEQIREKKIPKLSLVGAGDATGFIVQKVWVMVSDFVDIDSQIDFPMPMELRDPPKAPGHDESPNENNPPQYYDAYFPKYPLFQARDEAVTHLSSDTLWGAHFLTTGIGREEGTLRVHGYFCVTVRGIKSSLSSLPLCNTK